MAKSAAAAAADAPGQIAAGVGIYWGAGALVIPAFPVA